MFHSVVLLLLVSVIHAQNCPSREWVRAGTGKCYKNTGKMLTFRECARTCDADDSSLLCIQNEQENDWIQSRWGTASIPLGLYQTLGERNPSRGFNNWASSGCNSTYNNWASAEPGDNTAGRYESCAVINFDQRSIGMTSYNLSGYWFDIPCTRDIRPLCICEWGLTTKELFYADLSDLEAQDAEVDMDDALASVNALKKVLEGTDRTHIAITRTLLQDDEENDDSTKDETEDEDTEDEDAEDEDAEAVTNNNGNSSNNSGIIIVICSLASLLIFAGCLLAAWFWFKGSGKFEQAGGSQAGNPYFYGSGFRGGFGGDGAVTPQHSAGGDPVTPQSRMDPYYASYGQSQYGGGGQSYGHHSNGGGYGGGGGGYGGGSGHSTYGGGSHYGGHRGGF